MVVPCQSGEWVGMVVWMERVKVDVREADCRVDCRARCVRAFMLVLLIVTRVGVGGVNLVLVKNEASAL